MCGNLGGLRFQVALTHARTPAPARFSFTAYALSSFNPYGCRLRLFPQALGFVHGSAELAQGCVTRGDASGHQAKGLSPLPELINAMPISWLAPREFRLADLFNKRAAHASSWKRFRVAFYPSANTFCRIGEFRLAFHSLRRVGSQPIGSPIAPCRKPNQFGFNVWPVRGEPVCRPRMMMLSPPCCG